MREIRIPTASGVVELSFFLPLVEVDLEGGVLIIETSSFQNLSGSVQVEVVISGSK